MRTFMFKIPSGFNIGMYFKLQPQGEFLLLEIILLIFLSVPSDNLLFANDMIKSFAKLYQNDFLLEFIAPLCSFQKLKRKDANLY